MLRLDSIYWHDTPRQIAELAKYSCAERVEKWTATLRSFNNKNPNECCEVEIEPKLRKKKVKFCTDSRYEGTWSRFGMTGRGVYIFPCGVKYVGGFYDNLFHGYGELRYPGNILLEGQWFFGLLTDMKLFLGCEQLKYDFDDWSYCKPPDRRFKIEYDNFIRPADKSFLTNAETPRKIPKGFYDTENGLFDPKTKFIYKSSDLAEVARKPSIKEQEWIINNCRRSSIGPVGPCPDLYETFVPPQRFLEDHQFSHPPLEQVKSLPTLLESLKLRKSMDLNHIRSKMVFNADSNMNIAGFVMK